MDCIESNFLSLNFFSLFLKSQETWLEFNLLGKFSLAYMYWLFYIKKKKKSGLWENMVLSSQVIKY